jgi:hypothetical protein
MFGPLLILGRGIEEETACDDLAAGIELAFDLGEAGFGGCWSLASCSAVTLGTRCSVVDGGTKGESSACHSGEDS